MATIIQTVDGVVANRFNIKKAALKFGRTSDNQVQIDDLAVSNEHAQIISKTGEQEKPAIFSKILVARTDHSLTKKK